MQEPWRWRAFAGMNGFDAQGKDGAFWFGTADGLSSYDGFEWTRHLADGGLLADWVSALCVHPDGTILVGSRHRFEVRSRDRDFIVDPTLAAMDFVVLPSVWRQAWFISLMILLGGLVATQTVRMFLDRSRLRRINRALATEIDARRQAAEEIRLLNSSLEQRVHECTDQLAVANKELETFSYSVSHDLRAPLRSIEGFSRMLLEDYTAKLDDEGKDSLRRICAATKRMSLLIDNLLNLARVSREVMQREEVNLSALAGMVAERLRQAAPNQSIEFVITPNLTANCDGRLMQVVLENLFGNACKFSRGRPVARIEFGRTMRESKPAFFVRDNGAGFDLGSAQKLFGAFQRFHSTAEFPGTGIGLATVQRIIHRHGGLVWAESQPDHGATFYFTLAPRTPETPKTP